jgi:hypothetical protein
MDVPKTIRHKPLVAIVVGVITLVIVLLIEAYKPGLITGPIRKGLQKLGVKTA